jgi:hypothetical protein
MPQKFHKGDTVRVRKFSTDEYKPKNFTGKTGVILHRTKDGMFWVVVPKVGLDAFWDEELSLIQPATESMEALKLFRRR